MKKTRKLIALLLVVAALAGLLVTGMTVGGLGGTMDLDGDKKITMHDAQLAKEHEEGKRTLTTAQRTAKGDYRSNEFLNKILGIKAEEDRLNILLIGNSFATGFPDELAGMLEAAGIKARIYSVYYPGCSSKQHWDWLQTGSVKYRLRHHLQTGGTIDIGTINANTNLIDNGANLLTCLEQEEWDVIALQQHFTPARTVSYEYALSETETYAANMFSYLNKKHPQAKLVWYETWSYSSVQDATETDEDLADMAEKDRMQTIIRQVSTKIATDNCVEMIPCGGAWDIARTEHQLGNMMRDTLHDGYANGGQYMNACVWFESLTGLSCIGNTYRPTAYTLDDTDNRIATLQEIAHRAVEENPAPKDPVPNTFQGLVLVADPKVQVNLYSGFNKSASITPTNIYKEDTRNYYCYTDLDGAYCYTASGGGRYSVTQNLFITSEEASKKIAFVVTPKETSDEGWDASSIKLYTEEQLNNGFKSYTSLWPQYAEGFTTPYFTQEHNEHQMTTQAQLESFLQGLDDADDDLYLYSVGASGANNHNIPMAVFTTADLSKADTVEKAAAAMDNGKPTILYRAQIHGNEPAACEAALAVIRLLDGSWNHYLEQMNICIVPRSSPDGAQNYIRRLSNNIDPNRDNLRLRSTETQSYMRLCQVIDPQIIIDGHEYDVVTTNTTINGADLMLGLGYGNENTPAFQSLMLDMSKKIFTKVEENGLDGRYYSNYSNSVDANISRSYAARQGTMFFLLESLGVGGGLSFYARRIAAQISSVESIFDQTAQNPKTILDVVAKEKQNIIDKGAVYDEDDRIALSTKAVEDSTLNRRYNRYDQTTGLSTIRTAATKVYNNVVSDRIAPTAYVISADESFTEDVLELMDKHAITYTFIPEGSRVLLQQYDKNETDMLTEETTVTFPNGAYVFCKNQVRGVTLSMLMEPDIKDLETYSGTLVQQGMITDIEGKYPIYRYIHDLNTDGFIDFQ